MPKKVIPFPPRKAPPATPAPPRILIHLGARRYTLSVPSPSPVLPPEPAPVATPGRLEQLQVQAGQTPEDEGRHIVEAAGTNGSVVLLREVDLCRPVEDAFETDPGL